MVILLNEFPHSLDGTDIIGDKSKEIPNKFRNFLEIIYFVSNVAVIIVAIITAIFARNQILLSRATHNAQVLLHFSNHLISRRYFSQITEIYYLNLEYNQLNAAYPYDRLEYITDKLVYFEDEEGRRKSVRIIRLLGFVENFSLLIRRQYLSLDDVYYLLEGELKLIYRLLGSYLEDQARNTPGMWEHTIWLLRKVECHSPKGSLLQ
jgi:hypothetical protein